MANEEHLRILKQGVEVWNRWREDNPEIIPDLDGAELKGENLGGANLEKANLSGAELRVSNLIQAKLVGAKLAGADLTRASLTMASLDGADLAVANLTRAKLIRAYLIEANLDGAKLTGADLDGADLTRAKLNGADLTRTHLVETKIVDAVLTNCKVYGISAWGLKGIPEDQSNLIITRDDEPVITVDNLEVAQFIYLLLHSRKIRYAIDSIAKKAVLILGRFTAERMVVLNAIRDELRKQGYLPILFYFERPESLDFIETVSTLAHISRFVVADVTDPRIVIEEVPHIVHNVAVPVKPLLLEGSEKHELVTLGNLRINHRSLLKTFEYKNLEHLLTNFKTEVIDPAEQRAEELYLRRIEELAHPNAANQ